MAKMLLSPVLGAVWRPLRPQLTMHRIPRVLGRFLSRSTPFAQMDMSAEPSRTRLVAFGKKCRGVLPL